MAEATRGAVPIPILVYSGLLALLGLVGGVMSYVDPSSSSPGLNLDTAADTMLAMKLGARSLALALGLGLAIALRKPALLGFALGLRLLSELQDLAISFFVPGGPPVQSLGILVLVFILPQAYCVWKLFQIARQRVSVVE